MPILRPLKPVNFMSRRVQKMMQDSPQDIRNFSKGQNTGKYADKLAFDEFQAIQNMCEIGEDLEARRGITDLATITDIKGIGIYLLSTGNKLVGTVKTSTTSKLVTINRTTGATSDYITGITGIGAPQFASLRDWIYVVNGSSDVQKYNTLTTTSGSIATPSGKPTLITTDGSRLWCFADGTLWGSKLETDDVTSFDSSGTTIGRGIIANSKITNATALRSIGQYIILACKDRVEVHKIPDFQSGYLTTYPQDIPSLVHEWTMVGCDTAESICPLDGDYFSIKSNDGFFYICNVSTGEKKQIVDDRLQMQDLDWSQCAMGYDQRNQRLFISGKDSIFNDITVVYNLVRGHFSYYTGVYAKQWAWDTDNMYYLQNFDNKVVDAFRDDTYTDNGTPVPVMAILSKNVAGTLDYYKLAENLFLNVLTGAPITLLMEFFSDRRIGSTTPSVWSESIAITSSTGASPYVGSWYDSFGASVFGGGSYDYTSQNFIEYVEADVRKIGIEYLRGELKFSASVSGKFLMRGLGYTSKIGSRKTQGVNLS